jgi:hypothetical protein
MGRPKKNDTVTLTVDEKKKFIKSDQYENQRDDDGYITIKLSSKGAEDEKRYVEKSIRAQKEKLESLKEKMDEIDDCSDKKHKKKKDKDKKKKDKNKKDKKKKDKDKPKSKRTEAQSRFENVLLQYSKDKDVAATAGKKGKKGKKDKDKNSKKKKKNKEPILGAYKSPKVKTKKGDAPEKEDPMKKESLMIEKRFEPSVKIIAQNIKDLEKLEKLTLDEITKLQDSRTRGKETQLSNFLRNSTDICSSKLQHAKELANIQKIRTDLEYKRSDKVGGAKMDDVALLSRALPKLMNKEMSKDIFNNVKKHKGKNKEGKGSKGKNDNRSDTREALFNKASKLVKDGKIEFSDHELYVEMEGKYDIGIRKAYDDGEGKWQFIGIDRANGRIIPGFKDKYPGLLPAKKSVSLIFDDEKEIARDTRSDTVYRVQLVPRL